jgi:large subunit ribosomal protein L17
MRHRKKHSKLGMKTSHRKATLRNIAKSLLKYQRIEISLARAKEVRRLVEHLITLSKDDTVNSRRHAFDILTDRDLVGVLFKEIAPLFKGRGSGYTRIIPIGFRRGDGASMCIIELTERKIVEKLPKKEKKAKPESVAKQEIKKVKAGGEVKDGKPDEVKKHEPKIKAIPKSKPTLDEEKRSEKARSESKKLSDNKKGFMKNIRGLFRKRGDF